MTTPTPTAQPKAVPTLSAGTLQPGKFAFAVNGKYTNLTYDGTQHFRTAIGNFNPEAERLRLTRFQRWKPYELFLKEGTTPPETMASNNATECLREADVLGAPSFPTTVQAGVELDETTKAFFDELYEAVVDAAWKQKDAVFSKNPQVKNKEAVRVMISNNLYQVSESNGKAYAEFDIPCSLRYGDALNEEVRSLQELSAEERARLVVQPTQCAAYYQSFSDPTAPRWDIFKAFGDGGFGGVYFLRVKLTKPKNSPMMKLRADLVAMCMFPVERPAAVVGDKRTVDEVYDDARAMFEEFNESLPPLKKLCVSDKS